ncbi:15618_t:CDS:2 [Funneliformis caledonium]|uniref:15618_t:CDS:1 n=1 Tax=Funneliformis caledonium TaxID=1117310 RepID=A0A9N8WM12_9GLOM|nr:15618_t:CDS:2 [Funneliformis caledonium]
MKTRNQRSNRYTPYYSRYRDGVESKGAIASPLWILDASVKRGASFGDTRLDCGDAILLANLPRFVIPDRCHWLNLGRT